MFNTRITALAVTAMLTACSGTNDPERSRIVTFSAADLLVEPGAKTTLSWDVQNVASLSINAQNGTPLLTDARKPEGTVDTNPIDTHTVFVMRAEGVDGRTIGASVLVRVNFPAPTIDEFTAAPEVIRVGERTLLRWATTNATTVTIVDDEETVVVTDGSPDDTLPVDPAGSRVYTIIAEGPGGTVMADTSVTVEGTPPEIIRFDAAPTAVFAGEPSVLRWEVLNADSVRIALGGTEIHRGPSNAGTVTVNPTAPQTYQLAATNTFGSKTSSVTVMINAPAPPTIEAFTATPNPAAIGGMATLSWQTTAGRRLVVSSGGVQVFVTNDGTGNGTVDITVTSTQARYTLSVENDFGTATDRIELFGHLAPNVVDFSVTPRVFTGSRDIRVDWDVQNISRLSLLRNGTAVPSFVVVDEAGGTVDRSGTITVTASVTALLELVAESGGGIERRYAAIVNGVAETEPNNAPNDAQVLAASELLGELETTTDVDIYAVDVPVGGAVFAETSGGPGYCGVDTQLTLLDIDGTTPLVFDDDDGIDTCSRIDPATDLLAAGLAAGRYYVVVDSGGAGAGEYVLTVDVRGPSCGDGARESSEQCDDGNVLAGDGCDSNCMYEVSPIVVTAPGGTQTVTLASASAFAVIAVDLGRGGQAMAARASDAGDMCLTVDTALELRDVNAALLGAKSDGGPSGVAGDCAGIRYPDDMFATNLVADRHYLIVRAEGAAFGPVTVTVTIREPACGNGLVESRAMEQCDDNNTANGDGCSALCRLESGVVAEVEANGTQATANSSGVVGLGVVNLQGMISPIGDDDVYSFVVPAGQALRVSARTYTTAGNVMSCDSALTDTRIFLEAAGTEVSAPGMGELAFNDDIDNPNNVWCSALTNVQVVGGVGGSTYFVRVQGWRDMAPAAYFMELRVMP